MVAVDRGVNVVVGSSGLTAADYAEIEEHAEHKGVAVVAAGNFSITAALAKAAAVLAVRHILDWEIIDYAHAGKADAPSGTARELAETMTAAVASSREVSTSASLPARGEAIGQTRVHSLRLPSFSVSTEVVFGMPDERLTIRHDAGSSVLPYVAGTLLAVRAAITQKGLVRGLDQLLIAETT
jgi:4-hydroxy-tetrahydrodipicolinate reductase